MVSQRVQIRFAGLKVRIVNQPMFTAVAVQLGLKRNGGAADARNVQGKGMREFRSPTRLWNPRVEHRQTVFGSDSAIAGQDSS